MLIGAAGALAAWSFYPALRVHYQESSEQARLESELESLKERNDELSGQIDRLRTPEGVEEVARESLGMVKPGENLYMVFEQEATATTAAAGSTVSTGSAAAKADEGAEPSLLDRIFGDQ